MRLDMNVPVLALSLILAAVAQELTPVREAGVKAPFLTSVALYYALTRPLPVSLTALLWAGMLTDALGGLPLFCTFSFLLAAYGAARFLQRVFLEPTLVQGTLFVACAAAGQTLWTLAWVGGGAPFFSWRTLASLAVSVPAGLAVGLVGFAFCGLVDRFSGITKPVKEGNGILWAETDR